MNASSGSKSGISNASGGKRRLLAGTGGAALALALLLPSAALARDYTAGTEAELRQAILDANADGDPSSTITLTGNIAIAASLPNSNKPLVINTGAFSTNGIALTGIVTVIGAVNGNDDTLTGSGQTGLRVITFGGLPTTVTNNATVTGGDGTNNSTDGLGAEIQHNGSLINNGSITGGSSGGPGSLNGGYGLQMTGTSSVVNNGLIQGGTGIGVTGGRGAFVGVNPSAAQTFTNNATGVVRGGEGTGGALGGVGIFVNLIRTPIINHGLIEGGNGAAAIVSRPETNIINSGIIRAGAGGTVAIDATLSPLTLIELRAGSSITGLVLANASGAFAQTLQLGGTVNASFDMSSVGATAQYRNFNRFVKAGTSSWTLTGNASTMPGSVWELQQGTLVFDGSATGQTGSMLGNGALVFQQDGALSVGSLNGAISVLQSGSGTTTLVGNNHSLGTTITGGKLSIDAENALGSGAFTITGGALQWTGNGSIARSINWGASGAEIEVAGNSLTLDQPLLGGGALTKSGSGTLILNGANSYTGGTTISAGTLRLNGSILGNVLNNGTLIFGNAAAYTHAGLVTGSGDVSVVGTGLLTLTGNSNFGGTLTVNSASGGLNISGGAIVSWAGETIHSNGQLLVNAGARATSVGITTITSSSATPTTLTVDGPGSTFSTDTINAAGALNRNITVSVTNGGRLTTTAGDLNIRAATVSAASTNTGQLIIDGAGSLADLAGGLLIANSNITNGKLTISGGGTLRTAGSSRIGFPTGNIRGVPSLRITGAGSNWTSTNMLGVSNGDFTLDQGGTASFTSATFGTAAAGAKLTVSGVGSRFATTSGDLVLGLGSGMGELVLSAGGAVNLAGSLILADAGTATGILNIGGGEGQAAAAGGTLTAQALNLGSATSRINFNHTDPGFTFAGAITGSGALNQRAGTSILTGASTYSGVTTVSGGTLQIAAAGKVTGTARLNLTGGQVIVDGTGSQFASAGASAVGTGALTVRNGGSSTFGALSVGDGLGTNGTINVIGDGSQLTSTGDFSTGRFGRATINILSGGKITTAAASTLIGGQSATNAQAFVTISGAGSAWDVTNALNARRGTITIADGGRMTAGSAVIGAYLAGLNAPSFAMTVTGTGSRFEAGSLTIANSAASGTTGSLTIAEGGTVAVGGGTGTLVMGPGTATLNIGAGGGVGALQAGLVTTSAGSTINFNHFDAGHVFATGISGSGAINHLWGVTNLTGDSSGYTGTATVSGGTLRVNGTFGGVGSIVNVLNGGRLGGAGTIGGSVNVADGVLMPGNSPGTLTIAGNLNLSGASILNFEFGRSDVVGGPLNDLIDVGGNLTLDGTLNVAVTPGGSFDVGVYRIMNYGGVLTDNGLSLGVTPAGSIPQIQTAVAGQVNLVNFAGAAVNFWDGNGGRGDNTITGGTGVWQAASGNDNWTLVDGTLNNAYSDGNFAVFMAAPGTVTVDTSLGAVNASGMQFASNGYTLTGGTIGLTGAQSVIRVGDGTPLGAGFTATIASNLVGAGDLVKTDLGTLVLSGANSFAGEAIIKVGGLRLADGGTFTSLNTIIGGDTGEQAVLTVTGSNGGGNASTWTTGGLAIGTSGNGTLNVTNGGKVASATGTIGSSTGGVGTALISGAGSTWQNSARISVGVYGTGALRIENGAQVSSNDGIIGGSAQGNAIITGPGSSWTNTTQFTVGSFGAGTLRIENGASVTSNQGYIGANADGSVTVTGAGSNWLVSTFGLTIGNQGNGTLTIENGGHVQALEAVALGQTAGINATLIVRGTAANRGVLETGQVRAGAGTVNVTLDGGLLRAVQNESDFFSDFGTRDLTLGANGGVIDTNGHNIGIAPRFVGAGGLIKDGTGRLILSGANSYAGATLVNAGTLWINGDQSAATGLVTVGAVGTLGGIGIIGGSVDMSAGGTLAPGNSPGTLTINGNLLLGAGTQLNFELGRANVVGGALNDLVNVGGNLTLDGTLNVTESAGGSFGVGIYRLFNYGGGLTNNGLTIGVLPAGGNAFVQTGISGQVNLVNTGGATLNYWDGAAGPKFDNDINGGTGIWQNSLGNNNWTDASGAVNAAFTDNAVAIFGGSAGTVTVDNGPGAVGVTGMQFATTGYVITGGAVTLTGPQATIRVGDGTVAGAGHTATIASALTGASQLVLTDLGTLILTGTNSYAGGTRIDSGRLQIGNGGATGSITGDIVNNAALVVNRAGTLALDGAISGSGTLTKLGGGTLILTGTNSYAGGTTIGGGTVQVSSDANLGDVAGTLSLQGGMLRAGASFTSNRTILLAASNQIDTQGFDVTLGGAIGNGSGNQSGNFLDKLGSGTLTLTGANSYANRTLIAGGTLALSGAGTIGAGNLIVAPGTVFDISQTNAGARIVQLNSGPAGTIALGSKLLTLGLTASFSDWSGTITDDGIGGGIGGRVVITAPAGAVRFFEANSYTGGTTIASGTLELDGNGALYAGGALTINTGLFNIAGLAGAGTTIGDLSGSGSIALGAKSLTLGTANDSTSFAAISGNGGSLVKAGSGTFVFAGGATHTGGTTITAGTLQLGDGSLFGSIAGDILNNGTLAFNRAGEQAFDGVISGSGAVNQIGGGTTILTGANSYAGTTTVSNGTLRINGNQSAATGLTRVLNGGTLGGTGTIGGSVTVADGGTLAPGNSPGTLTIAGNLALSSGSRLAFEFGQANLAGGALNDLINVGGNLTLDGTIDVTESTGGSFGPGVFRIINYTGTLTDNGLSIGTIPAGSQTFVQTAIAGQVNLVNTAGLTLGFWDGVSGPKNDGAIQGGAGIWRVNDGANNWTTATGAINADYAQDSFAVFTGTGATVTIDNGNGNVRAAGMQFTVNGYTLTGGPLELTGTDAFVRVGDGSAGDGAITATIASALTGSARLVKDMGGTLVLTGTNSYTGGTAINGGTLSIASDANLGAVAGGLSFNGGTLRNTAAFASSRTIDLVGAGTLFTDTGLVLDGIVSGAGALAKDGAGTLVLTADNSYAGGTTIAAGMLQLGSGGTSGSITGPIVNNAQLAINRSNALTLGGVISGNGELLQTGTGTTVLTAANSYTGATRVSSGTLLINGNQSTATGLTVVAANATLGGTGTIGGSVVLGDGTLAPGAGGAGTLTINGNLAMAAGSRLAVDFGAANAVGSPLNDLINIGGNLTLDGTIDIAVTPGGSFDIGLYRVANYGGTLTNNGLTIGTMPAGAELFVQTSVNGQVNLVNTGSAVLNFWDGAAAASKFNNTVDGGSGMWRTALDDSWADATGAVNAPYDNGAFAIFTGTGGTVTIDNSLGAVTAAGLQFAANGYRIQGDALTLTGPQSVIRVGDGTNGGSVYTATIDAAITGTTQLVKTDLGRLELTGTNSYTGGTAINGGTLRIANDANLGAAAGGLSFNGGTLSTASDLSSARAIVLAGQGVLATDAGTTLTLTGGITGTGLLGKTGTGSLVLAGTGSHSGGIDAVQGMLLVNGNYAAATGPVTIRGGAAIGGTGTIGGDVSLAGTLTPGSGGAGTLTINGSLTIGQTATLAYEFGQANVAGGGLNDLVNVTGNLTLDGTINVTVPAGGNFSAGIYRVFNYGGTLTDNGLSLGAMPAGSNVGVQTAIAGQVNLINFAGLALNFWDGAAGPKNNGVVNGGAGVWQHSSGNDNWTEAAGLVNAGYSDGAFAVFGGTAGTVTVDNSRGQVSAGGMQFATGGYTVTGGGIVLTGGQATIRVGDGSTAGVGYTATISAALSGASELVKTDAGTLILSGTNSYAGGTRIAGGTVQIAGDANLGAAAGGVTFDGGTLATTATLSSARNVNLLGAGTLSNANGTVFTLGGVLSGTGALTKTGGGTLVLTGNSGGYAGATSLTGGTLAVMGVLGGAVDVRTGTRLEGTGSVGSVTNAGTVAPGRDGFGTLTINGSYTGANGTLAIDAELGGDGSRADRLVVNGATAGNTVVQVTNQGGLGAATVDGIKIVDVTGASNGVFTLGNSDYLFEGAPALIAGAYGYRLYKNGVTNPADGDWYLRSSLLQQPEIPLYQPGVPVYEAYGQTLAALNQLGTMQERTGNRQWAEGNARSFGIWGRSESRRDRSEPVRSTSFTDVNVDSWKIELGADQVLSERGDGASLVLGVLGSYGEASATIASPFGNGRIKTQGYSAGATLSWFGPRGFYIDSRAQVSWFDSKLSSTVLGKLADDNKGTGQAYSLEIGKRAAIGGGLSVTPQIQTVYSTVGFDRFTDPNDAAVSSKLGDSLRTRWGLSLDRQDARSHVYAVVNLSYEWLDGTITDVSGTRIARENHRLWGELGVGGSLKLGSRLTLYSEVSADTAVNDFGKSYSLKGVAGVRMAF